MMMYLIFRKKYILKVLALENNKADSLVGMGLGNNDTGVIVPKLTVRYHRFVRHWQRLLLI